VDAKPAAKGTHGPLYHLRDVVRRLCEDQGGEWQRDLTASEAVDAVMSELTPQNLEALIARVNGATDEGERRRLLLAFGAGAAFRTLCVATGWPRLRRRLDFAALSRRQVGMVLRDIKNRDGTPEEIVEYVQEIGGSDRSSPALSPISSGSRALSASRRNGRCAAQPAASKTRAG
jgi:hypothetical protein